MTDSQIEKVLGLFIIAARHARNFPHPQIPVERLRSEATLAEMNAKDIMGEKKYQRIANKYLNDES